MPSPRYIAKPDLIRLDGAVAEKSLVRNRSTRRCSGADRAGAKRLDLIEDIITRTFSRVGMAASMFE